MNRKIGSNKGKIMLVDLYDYIQKHRYGRYIFSSYYNREVLNENINDHTFRMNLVFKEMKIIFNPNQVLLYDFLDVKSTESQYIAIDRVKYARIKEFEIGVKIDLICENLLNDIDNHTYTIFAENYIK